MKKITIVLTVFLIASINLFAIVTSNNNETNNNVIVNGIVSENNYSLQLMYKGQDANLADTNFNLANTKSKTTELFSLERSNGNLNKDLEVSVKITADSFKGFANNKNITTTIVPRILLRKHKRFNYYKIKSNNKSNTQNSKEFCVTIPFGYHNKSNVKIAQFKLKVFGQENTIAGKYTSNVIIEYTYDQPTSSTILNS